MAPFGLAESVAVADWPGLVSSDQRTVVEAFVAAIVVAVAIVVVGDSVAVGDSVVVGSAVVVAVAVAM